MGALFKNTKVMGALVGAVVVALLYYFYASSSGTTPPLTTTNPNVPASQEILRLLGGLRNIDLDETIFEDEVFISLSDFGVTIPTEPVGRRNPFAPRGR